MIKQSAVTYETYFTSLKQNILGKNILIGNSQTQTVFDRCSKKLRRIQEKRLVPVVPS